MTTRRDIAAVMVTVDRSVRGQTNYLAETLANLVRGGMLTTPRLTLFEIHDSGTSARPYGWATDERDKVFYDDRFGEVYGHPEPVCANLNVAAALASGAASDAEFVLFLEDDIDVCADFFDSVGAWLDDHAAPDRLVYAFACPYPQVTDAAAGGATSWDYPIKGAFYGTQAFAVRSEDAADLAAFLRADPYRMNPGGSCWDLIMQIWALEKGAEFFLASAPSFAEHIGRESVVAPRPATHTCPSWPGREWSYLQAHLGAEQAVAP